MDDVAGFGDGDEDPCFIGDDLGKAAESLECGEVFALILSDFQPHIAVDARPPHQPRIGVVEAVDMALL